MKGGVVRNRNSPLTILRDNGPDAPQPQNLNTSRMMPHLLVRHKVADYKVWRVGFDAHLAERQRAGLTDLHVYATQDDPNDVVMMFTVLDMERAKEYAYSDDLAEALERFGVIGKPEAVFLE
jgi:hypothetical protein